MPISPCAYREGRVGSDGRQQLHSFLPSPWGGQVLASVPLSSMKEL